MLGDPTPEHTLAIVRTVVAAGADALELGVPFSDPVADGPTIQASHLRALDGGSTVDSALEQVRTIRAEFPELPIGMLIYGNVAFTRGFDRFYAEFAEAGADSILLPDVPVREGAPFITAAEKAGIDPIFIAPARATSHTLEGVAQSSRGYIYAVSRDGVTGAEKKSETIGLEEVVANIKSSTDHRYCSGSAFPSLNTCAMPSPLGQREPLQDPQLPRLLIGTFHVKQTRRAKLWKEPQDAFPMRKPCIKNSPNT